MDSFLERQASQAQAKNTSTTHVVVEGSASAPAPIVAFVTLAPCIIPLIDTPAGLRKTLHHPEVNGQLIAQMGVDKKHQNKKLGIFLVNFALVTCHQLSRVSAFPVIVVDAANAELVSFYQKFDFAPLHDNPLRLCLMVETLDKALRQTPTVNTSRA